LELFMPPNVAGWPAFYQAPVFYQSWISSDSLPKRVQFTDTAASAKGFKTAAFGVITDVTALAKRAAADPGDLATLLNGLAALLFPITPTQKQQDYLKEALLGGLPDYEWRQEWTTYMNAPTDPNSRLAVETRLRALITAMMEMAEFQLC
jgi:hypothetical protein